MPTHSDKWPKKKLPYIFEKKDLGCWRRIIGTAAEIDLIVQKNDQLVAVEVKARSSKFFGAPYSFVSSKKINLMIMAMDAFVHLRKLGVDLCFDIMSYTLADGNWYLEHLENAFYPF